MRMNLLVIQGESGSPSGVVPQLVAYVNRGPFPVLQAIHSLTSLSATMFQALAFAF